KIGDISYKTLVVEIMGRHSHLILVDPEKKSIIDSMKHVPMSQNRYRTILPGAMYKLPPQQDKVNPLEIDDDLFIRRLDFNAGKIHQQMVNLLTGMSPFIAKELVYRANLGSEDVYRKVFLTFQRQLQTKDYHPAIYTKPKEDFHVLTISSLEEESE